MIYELTEYLLLIILPLLGEGDAMEIHLDFIQYLHFYWLTHKDLVDNFNV